MARNVHFGGCFFAFDRSKLGRNWVATDGHLLGDVADGANAFIKLQSQDGDGMFEYGAFYVGDNGEGEFFPLTTSTSSPATISAWLCGTYGFLQIKSAAGQQKYYYNYGTDFGFGAGLGTGGAVSLDNYKSGAGKCGHARRETRCTFSSDCARPVKVKVARGDAEPRRTNFLPCYLLLSMGGQEPPIQCGGKNCLGGRVLPGHGDKGGARDLLHWLIANVFLASLCPGGSLFLRGSACPNFAPRQESLR